MVNADHNGSIRRLDTLTMSECQLSIDCKPSQLSTITALNLMEKAEATVQMQQEAKISFSPLVGIT